MSEPGRAMGDRGQELLLLYDDAVAEVYRYLRSRCGSDAVAEDLTSETFLTAVDAITRQKVDEMTVAWLIGVARHKLVDHWRRVERQTRLLDSVGDTGQDLEDNWDTVLDAMRARQTLQELGPHHQGALTLRYLDGLPVAQVASHMGRTVGATEVLLVRARRAFRTIYEATNVPTLEEEGR